MSWKRAEVCRIVQRLPRQWDEETVRQLLAEKGCEVVSVTKRPNRDSAVVEFASATAAREATERLLRSTFGVEVPGSRSAGGFGRTKARARHADALQTAMARQRDSGAAVADWYAPLLADEARRAQRETVDRCAPLACMPLAEQRAWKQASVAERLRHAAEVTGVVSGHEFDKKKRQTNAPERYSALQRLLVEQRGALQRDLEALPLLPLQPAPFDFHYRNKCEFTVGRDGDERPCVGFSLGNHSLGNFSVGDPSACPHVSALAMRARHALQAVVERSPLAPWDKRSKSGYWRSVLVRNSIAEHGGSGDALVALYVADEPALHGATAELVAAERRRAERALVEACGAGVSIVWYNHSRVCAVVAPDCPSTLSHGSGYVRERMAGVEFKVSPTSFFQANVPAAAQLFDAAGQWCAPTPNTLLLDVCCGVGVAALLMAPRVARVVGVDIDEAAVRDARASAAANGRSNVDFVAAPAEVALPALLAERRGQHDHVSAIVDPPRGGLHPAAAIALRNSPVDSIVYISCNVDALLEKDLPLLATTPTSKIVGPPFKPVRLQAFDLFPHTAHVECMMLLTRQL